jgi:DNA-binding Lrp family transcriptional regulator
MRLHNRQVLLQALINGQNVSRLALAEETGFSPSTVSSIVSELIDEGVLIESGVTLPTAGRGRKELDINSAYGAIAVIEISRQRTGLCVFDMTLKKKDEKQIALRRLSGNTLFSEISSALFDNFYHSKKYGPMAGIGLLFREDMIESDLSVMFSTSLSADNISLREALYTQFKVPVIGEYSVSEMLNHIETSPETKNSALITTMANRILLSMTIDGKPLEMRNGKNTDISRLLSAFSGPASGPPKRQVAKAALPTALTRIITFLCILFPLDTVFISGKIIKKTDFLYQIQENLNRLLSPASKPVIRAVEPPDSSLNGKMAVRMRKIILSQIDTVLMPDLT